MTNDKNDEEILKELRLINKTKDYFEIQKYIKFYERIVEVLKKYKNQLRIIELNEDPFIKDTNFAIDLTSFLLFIGNYEYLLFTQISEVIDLDNSIFIKYIDLFSKYYNKKGFFILWNDEHLTSLLFLKDDLYNEEMKNFAKVKSQLIPFETQLNILIRTKQDFKLKLTSLKKKFPDFTKDLEIKLGVLFKNKANKEIEEISADINKFQKDYIINKIIVIFDDYIKSKKSKEEVKDMLLKLYDYKLT